MTPAKPVGSAVGKPALLGAADVVTFFADPPALGRPLTVTASFAPPPRKPFGSAGLRSSEFWLCSFCACVGSALALWAASPLDLAGAMLLGLATASYAWSRGKAKGRSVVQGKL